MPGITPLLDAARTKRTSILNQITTITDAVQKDGRTALTEDETSTYRELDAQLPDLDENIRSFEAQLAREERAAQASVEIEVPDGARAQVSSPMTYEHWSRSSYLRDLAAIMVPQSGLDDGNAHARMAQHHKEMDVEARRDPKLALRLHEMRNTPAGLRQEQRVNPNTTYGTGGEFVPPLWLVNEYVPFMRPGRVIADRIGAKPLPPGIDVINLPRITMGSKTGVQPVQGGAVTSRDMQTTTVSAAVITIAGQEDISVQLLEQSPISMDGVVYDDLSRDYDQQFDSQVIAGSGAPGFHRGVMSLPGSSPNVANTGLINQVTVASPVFFDAATAGTQYRSVVNGVNQIETNRFGAPTAVWVNPRRANWWACAADSQGRPLYIPAKYGVQNGLGLAEGQPVPQGVAGEIYGLPVIKDANMPTTCNGVTATKQNLTGGTADTIAVVNEDDLLLWEGAVRMRALPEILSGTLQIRFQLYAYSAFMPDRYAPSISILSGNTGLAAPSF